MGRRQHYERLGVAAVIYCFGYGLLQIPVCSRFLLFPIVLRAC